MAYFGLPLAGFEDLPWLGYGRGREKNTRAITTWRQGEAGESRARRGSGWRSRIGPRDVRLRLRSCALPSLRCIWKSSSG